jgi:acyl-CoA synthetase (AMP-forming)/AMP-acid ligase II
MTIISDAPPAVELTGAVLSPAWVVAHSIEEMVRPFGCTTTGVTFVGEQIRLTYHELAVRISAAAARLREHGVRPGTVVATSITNDSASVISALSVWAAGATLASLPPMKGGAALHVEQFTRVLATLGCDVLVVDDESPAMLLPGARRIGKDELAAAPPTGPGAEVAGPPVALIQFTSGSVAAPKGVAVSGARLAGHLQALSECFGYDPAHDKFYSWLPLYHDMGLVAVFLAGFSGRIEMVLDTPRRFALNPAGWLNAVAEHRATVSGAPNFAFRVMSHLPFDDGLDLSHVRILLCGAERVFPETMTGFHRATERFGLRWETLTPSYGSAENVVGISAAPRERGPLIGPAGHVSVGLPMPGVRIRTAGTPQAPAPIEITGSWLFDGYHTADGFVPVGRGWFDTGDDGFLADGELYVLGRRAEVVCAGGRNVFAEDIEEISTRAGGAQVRVCVAFRYGTPADRFGVIVELSRGRYADADAADALGRTVRDAVRESHGVRVSPVVVTKPGAIRRTTSGKVQRARSRVAYERGDIAGKVIAEIS